MLRFLTDKTIHGEMIYLKNHKKEELSSKKEKKVLVLK